MIIIMAGAAGSVAAGPVATAVSIATAIPIGSRMVNSQQKRCRINGDKGEAKLARARQRPISTSVNPAPPVSISFGIF